MIYPTDNSTELKNMMGKLFQNLTKEISQLREDNTREFSQLREDSIREFSQLRKEFNQSREDNKREFSQLRKEFSEIKKEFSEIKKDFSQVRKEFSEIKKEFSEIKKDFSQITEDFSQMREEKKQSDLKLEDNIEDLKFLIKEKKPKVVSMKSMVRVEAEFGQSRTRTGCGNLIKFLDKYYIVTASHIIKDFSLSCGCSAVKITYGSSNKTIEVDFDNILIHESMLDIALIPLKISNLNSKALIILKNSTIEISESDISIGDNLSGYCPVDDTFVYTYGRVIEQKGTYFETDITGTHGWSGCGLFDVDGKLIGVYIREGEFKHAQGKSKFIKKLNITAKITSIPNDKNSTFNTPGSNITEKIAYFSNITESVFQDFPSMLDMRDIVKHIFLIQQYENQLENDDYIVALQKVQLLFSKMIKNPRTTLISIKEIEKCTKLMSRTHEKCSD